MSQQFNSLESIELYRNAQRIAKFALLIDGNSRKARAIYSDLKDLYASRDTSDKSEAPHGQPTRLPPRD